MGLTTAKLAGHLVTSGRVYLHAWGAWYADLAIDSEVSLTGAVEVVVNDLTLKGTVLSGGPAFGRSDFRIVGGAGGWGKALPKKGYATDAGVKLSTVVADAAREAGETIDASTVPGDRIGPQWTRDAGMASEVLQSVAPSAWYVGEDGVTRFGRRPVKQFTGQASRVSPIDKARRRLTVAAEAIAELVPGVVVDGLEAIDVVHAIDHKTGLRTTIYGKDGLGSGSQLLDAFAKIIDQLDPDRVFRGTYEYRVVTLSGNRLNLQPVLVSTGMPSLQNVPMRTLAGANPTCALGSKVLVTWVNAERGRPVVVGFEDPDGEGFMPVVLRLGLGLLPVARATDVAGPWPIAATQTKVLA